MKLLSVLSGVSIVILGLGCLGVMGCVNSVNANMITEGIFWIQVIVSIGFTVVGVVGLNFCRKCE